MAFRRYKVFHINQVWLSEPLTLAFNQANLFLQIRQQLDCLFVSAVHVSHNFFNRVDDIHTALLIDPAVLRREGDAIQQDSVQGFRLC